MVGGDRMAERKRKGEWLVPESFDINFWPRSISKYLDRLFYAPFSYLDKFTETPDIDLIDNGDKYTIRADLPGVRKEDIKLKVNKDSITISAETKKEKEEKRSDYYYSERASASYFRRIPLPSEVVPESADAKFEDGTLEINVKKTKEEGKEVTIK